MGDRVARIAAIAAVFALGALGLALTKSILVGGLAWLAFLFFVVGGWGSLVVRIARVDEPDFALRAVWGIAGILAVAGPLVMLGVFSRPVALVVVAVGAGAFAWREWTTPVPIVATLRELLRFARANPVLAYVTILVGAAVVLQLVGAVAKLDRSPWDDDVAYTPFLKRLLDTGDLVEPFSFRRLAAYGGQTVMQALVGCRGNIASVHAFDQGLCYGLVFLLILGHARHVRANAFWVTVVVLAVLLMQDISINTASYWSGAMLFLAMYRTAVRQNLWMLALIAAATCTIRQNYIPVAGLFIIFTLVFSKSPRGTWVRVMAIIGAVMLPWCIAAFISNHTFLFPFMKGTWNAGMTLGPSGWTWVDELSLFLTTAIYSTPIMLSLVVAPLIVVASDARSARPLHAMFLASVIGMTILIHSFTDADSETMWRYAFGYSLTLFVAFSLEAATDRDDNPVRLAPLGRWVLIAAMLLQIGGSRTGHIKAYASMLGDISEAAEMERHGDPTAQVERQHYAAMQAAVPAGAKLLVMLDDAWYLDFSRNDIANLDVPGFASPGKRGYQMPYFVGAEAKRSYLLQHGYRYVAFVRLDRSRYAFRRGFWEWRIFHDSEFFQAMSVYSLDVIDSFIELSTTTKVLYDVDGLVVLDLEGPRTTPAFLEPKLERRRRDDWTAQFCARNNFSREWALTDRGDFMFVDGTSGLTYGDDDEDRRWNDATRSNRMSGLPLRWLYRRAHFRMRADGAMHLVLRGHVSLNSIHTRPRFDVSLDGKLLTSITADETTGAFSIDLSFAAGQLAQWSDLYVVSNAIGQPDRDARDLRLARLEEVIWEPR